MAPAHHLGSKKLVSIAVNPFVEGFCSSAFVIGDLAVCSAVVTASIGSAFQPEMAQSDGLNRKLPFLDGCLFHRTMRVLEI